MSSKISEVCVYPIKPTEKGLIAFASLIFENKLSLNSIAVYTRPDGSDIRLLFPTKLLPNGKEMNIFYPINREVYEDIKEAIIKKMEELVGKTKGGSQQDVEKNTRIS